MQYSERKKKKGSHKVRIIRIQKIKELIVVEWIVINFMEEMGPFSDPKR